MSTILKKSAVPLGVVGILMLLVVPIPTGLLDVLIIVNILFGLVILMTTMFTKKPLDFSVFPSLLLVATLFRLGLNVASTRLILGDANAGQVIDAFGQVTVGGNVVIGAVVFLILIVIQFVVVTKGAERVSEVGARFKLDAMPGKQMAIDADLNAGFITDTQARERRAEVAAEADFYGAMDGASKFVKGDAIAGIVIIAINLIAGVAVGMLMHGMEAGEALSIYAILTIGDGLVTQIPALLMSVSTGMIATRATGEQEMGSTAGQQLLQSQMALTIAGVAAIVLGIIPGMPAIPFFIVGAVLLIVGQRVKALEKKKAEATERDAAAEQAKPAEETPGDLIEKMRVSALEVQLASNIVDLASGGPDDLLARVKSLRRRIALDLGFLVPPVRTRDSIDLPPSTYAIRIAGVEAGRGTVPPGQVLALGAGLSGLPGEEIVDPVFGLPGKWVPNEMRQVAEMSGATVIDRSSVVATHLSDLVQAHASRLLTREDVRQLADALREHSPSAVDELTPALLSLAEVQRVLAGLLEERVPINDLARIFEALTLRAKTSTDPEQLIEAAREAVGPAIVNRFAQNGTLRVVLLDPTLEQEMLEAKKQIDGKSTIVFDVGRIERLTGSIRSAIQDLPPGGEPVVVCSPGLRPAVRRLVSLQAGGIPVLSFTEATSAVFQIETVGIAKDMAQIAA